MKKIKGLLALCAMVCVMVSVSACTIFNGLMALGPKTHNYSTEWDKDANNHWHACTDEGCTEKSDEAVHTYGEGEVTTQATEEAEGVMTYTCTVCDYKKTEKIEKLPHSHKLTKVNEVAASCTETGTKAYYSCGCGKLFSDAEGKNEITAPEAIKKLDHVDGDKDHKCDTCPEEMGTHVAAEGKHTCDYCGKKASDCADENKDHNCDVCNEKLSDCADENKDHGCDLCGADMGTHEAAEGKHTCDYCGKVVTTCEGNYDEGKVETNATCTEKGVKIYTCTVCGETKTESIPANGHKDGNGDYECDICEASLCTAHQADEVVVENKVDATCENGGSYDKVVYCTACGEELSRETVTVDELGHSPMAAVKEKEVKATCEADGSYDSVVYCATCEEELSRTSEIEAMLGHAWGDGEVTTEATCSTDGVRTYTCGNCGETKTETIEANATLHAWNEATCKDAKTCAVCGETEGEALGHDWYESYCKNCNAMKYEAEAAALQTEIVNRVSIVTKNTTYGTSGDGFVEELATKTDAVMTFNVTADADTTALLSLCMGRREYEIAVSDMFTIAVNGEALTLGSEIAFSVYDAENGVKYYDWAELDVATLNLKKGDNVITLTRTATTKCLNFDYITLKSEATLQYTSEVANGGHTYNWEVITAPTYESAGELGAYCATCRNYKKLTDLPAVSTDNGYTLVSMGGVSVWDYTYEGQTYKVLVEESETTTYRFSVKDNNPFADGVGSAGGATLGKSQYYEKAQGCTFTTNINVSKATSVTFIIQIVSTNGNSYTYHNIFTSIELNGATDGVLRNQGTVKCSGWSGKKDVAVATLCLQEGNNTISFTMGTKHNVNIYSIAFISLEAVELGSVN